MNEDELQIFLLQLPTMDRDALEHKARGMAGALTYSKRSSDRFPLQAAPQSFRFKGFGIEVGGQGVVAGLVGIFLLCTAAIGYVSWDQHRSLQTSMDTLGKTVKVQAWLLSLPEANKRELAQPPEVGELGLKFKRRKATDDENGGHQ